MLRGIAIFVALLSFSFATLVGYWPLDGVGADGKVPGYRGNCALSDVPSGTPSASVTFGTGKVGNAASFGATGSITNGNWIAGLSTSLTIAAFVFPTDVGRIENNSVPILTKQSSPTLGQSSWGIAVINPPDTLRTRWMNSGGTNSEYICTNTMFAAGVWTHVAVTFNGSVVTHYVNGSPVCNAAVTGFAQFYERSTDAVFIGNDNSGTNGWIGALDEIRLYNEPLSSAQVYALATGQFVPPPSVHATHTAISGTQVLFDNLLDRSNTAGVNYMASYTMQANSSTYTVDDPSNTSYFIFTAGTYRLKITISDGNVCVNGTVSITITDPPPSTTTSPTTSTPPTSTPTTSTSTSTVAPTSSTRATTSSTRAPSTRPTSSSNRISSVSSVSGITGNSGNETAQLTSSGSSNTVLIAAIAGSVGGAAVLAAVGVLAFFLFRKHRNSGKMTNSGNSANLELSQLPRNESQAHILPAKGTFGNSHGNSMTSYHDSSPSSNHSTGNSFQGNFAENSYGPSTYNSPPSPQPVYAPLAASTPFPSGKQSTPPLPPGRTTQSQPRGPPPNVSNYPQTSNYHPTPMTPTTIPTSPTISPMAPKASRSPTVRGNAPPPPARSPKTTNPPSRPNRMEIESTYGLPQQPASHYSPTMGADENAYSSRFGNSGNPVKPAAKPKKVDRYEISESEITYHDEIGRGAYGIVYSATYRNTPVAVKQIKADVTEKDLAEFTAEADLMQAMKPHMNVILLYGICTKPFCIVTEYAEKGSLKTLLFSQQTISKKLVHSIIKDIARGMYHLQMEKIVHKDLAARNVLLSSNYTAKVADFGLSRLASSEDNKVYTKAEVGPVKWMAPESLTKRLFSTKSDAWAFGVCMVELLTRRDPYPNFDNVGVISLVITGETCEKDAPPNAHPILKEVLSMCFQREAEKRADFKVILAKLDALPE